jgi:hypothetical protein
MSKSVSYFIERAEECIKMALNGPKRKQSELLRLANEWLLLGHEAEASFFTTTRNSHTSLMDRLLDKRTCMKRRSSLPMSVSG